MKRLLGLVEMIADIARQKSRSADGGAELDAEGAEPSGAVFDSACARLATSPVLAGFKYAKRDHTLSRVAGEFTHTIHFQSSHHNAKGRRVALWVHATVGTELIPRWRANRGERVENDFLAGGQIGNLLPAPRWIDWDLASADARPEVLADVLKGIEALAMPLFARFVDRGSALRGLLEWPFPGLEPVQAIELSLALNRKELAERVLARFFETKPEFVEAYRARVAEPGDWATTSHWNLGFAKNLAKATVLYGLAPPPTGQS